MNKCHSCGQMNKETSSFCSQCGAALLTPSRRAKREEQKEKPQTSRTRTMPVALALVTILFIGLFTGYQLLAKKYSEEAFIEQFKSALIKKDKDMLKKMIVPSDSRIIVNNQSLDALIGLIDKKPSLVQDMESTLRGEELGKNLFTLYKDGKQYGLFDRYYVDMQGYFVAFEDPGIETKIYLNESEIGVLDGSKEKAEFGPFLAGVYDVKAVYKNGEKTMEDVTTVELSGTKGTTEMALNIQPAKKESEKEEEVKEKTVVKEVIREVPVRAKNNFYVLPHSSYEYLTYSDIAGLSKKQLRIARNEIYARHGYVFSSKDLINYFNNQAWYVPDPSYNGSLSSVEEYNVHFIKSFE